LVAGASGPYALEAERVNITASAEERAKECDFFVWWGGVRDGVGFRSSRREIQGPIVWMGESIHGVDEVFL
jgi:hypothetical protein